MKRITYYPQVFFCTSFYSFIPFCCSPISVALSHLSRARLVKLIPSPDIQLGSNVRLVSRSWGCGLVNRDSDVLWWNSLGDHVRSNLCSSGKSSFSFPAFHPILLSTLPLRLTSGQDQSKNKQLTPGQKRRRPSRSQIHGPSIPRQLPNSNLNPLSNIHLGPNSHRPPRRSRTTILRHLMRRSSCPLGLAVYHCRFRFTGRLLEEIR
jgi:hypothetical protein